MAHREARPTSRMALECYLKTSFLDQSRQVQISSMKPCCKVCPQRLQPLHPSRALKLYGSRANLLGCFGLDLTPVELIPWQFAHSPASLGHSDVVAEQGRDYRGGVCLKLWQDQIVPQWRSQSHYTDILSGGRSRYHPCDSQRVAEVGRCLEQWHKRALPL